MLLFFFWLFRNFVADRLIG